MDTMEYVLTTFWKCFPSAFQKNGTSHFPRNLRNLYSDYNSRSSLVPDYNNGNNNYDRKDLTYVARAHEKNAKFYTLRLYILSNGVQNFFNLFSLVRLFGQILPTTFRSIFQPSGFSFITNNDRFRTFHAKTGNIKIRHHVRHRPMSYTNQVVVDEEAMVRRVGGTQSLVTLLSHVLLQRVRIFESFLTVQTFQTATQEVCNLNIFLSHVDMFLRCVTYKY